MNKLVIVCFAVAVAFVMLSGCVDIKETDFTDSTDTNTPGLPPMPPDLTDGEQESPPALPI
jgi:hypothetical protein